MGLRSKTFTLPSSKTDDTQNTASRKFTIFKGLFLAMLSGIFYSLAAVIVKKIKNIHPAQVAVYRFIAIASFSLPSAIKCQENLLGPKRLRFLLVLRGIFGATNLFLNFVAFRYLPLGEAAVIIFSVPVFVTVAARLYLKEPCGLFQSFPVVLTVIGIVLTAKIPEKISGNSVAYSKESLYGMLAAVASLLFSTLRFIIIRKIKEVHHAVIMLNFGLVAVIETVLLTLFLGEFNALYCGVQGWHVIVLGIVSYIGQTLLTIALQCELAGPVSTMRAAADIVLAFVWQTFLFDDIPDAMSISGAVLVGVSVIFVGLIKYISSLPPESSHRKRFAWALSK